MFLFIIVFINLFSTAFGKSEQLIGVTVETGILMFKSLDLGIKKKQAGLTIILLFILTGITTTIAGLNPFLGVLINFASIFVIMYITTEHMEHKAYMTFILTYIFALGNLPTQETVLNRVASLTIGGILVAFVYWIYHRKTKEGEKEPTLGLKEMFQTIDIGSVRFVFCLKMALGITIGMLIGAIFKLPRAMWIGMTVMSLTQPEHEKTKERFKYRIIGTIGGIILFIILFDWLIPHKYAMYAVLLMGYVYSFVEEYHIQMLFITINAMNAAIILFDQTLAIPLRIGFVLLGSVIALILNKINFQNLCIKIKKKREQKLQEIKET